MSVGISAVLHKAYSEWYSVGLLVDDFSPEAVNEVRQGTGIFRLGIKSDKGLNTRLSIKANNKFAVCAF